jgi:HAMP domain-containing protein
MMITLKSKILILIIAAYLITGITAFFAFSTVRDRLVNQLGSGYAEKYALANKALIQEPLTREIALAQQLAQSAVIQQWMANEKDPELHRQAMKELEAYRLRLLDKSWFLVIGSSLNYYANDIHNKYAGRELVYTLSSTNAQDAWYFATLANVPRYALNVNYDRGLDVHKVWINVVIRDAGGRPLGVAGTGLDLSGFLKTFVGQSEPGVEHILLDQRLAIQAARDRTLIDQQSVATPENLRSDISRVIPADEDRARLNVALENLRKGRPAQTLEVTVNGNHRLLGVAYIRDLEWYELTLLDIDQIIGGKLLLPLFILIMLVTLTLLALSGWILNGLVLKPIAEITRATRRVSEGIYTPSLPVSTRQDEIGTLTRAFAAMNARIQDNTSTLESRISERTLELDKTNSALRENIDMLNEAHSKVRILAGMLPVCCSCNKIRDEKDQWQPLEDYVKEHTDASFSHGICPDCMHNLYPEFAHKPPAK